VDEAKLPPLVEEAQKLGIEIMPPDINISTNEFVIATDTKLFIPFNRVKGISDKTGEAIMRARALDSIEVEEKTKVGRKIERRMVAKAVTRGKFDSVEDFLERVEKRSCNVAHVDRLRKVGALHRIEIGSVPSLPPLHEDRRRDQYELIPGLMSSPVVIGRYMEPNDKYTILGINRLMEDMDAAFPKASIVRPLLGKGAKFVAIFDAANKTEEENKKMTTADSFDVVKEALFEAGLERQDGYWTALVKKTKTGSSVSPAEIAQFAPYLERELETLKPPLIIALGTNVARYLVPDIKGSIFDYVGKVIYDRKRDANILIGFTPGMIFHDPEKQDALNEVFERAASLVL
jgi:DNA polymerase-3 subunit alpha